MSSAFLLFHTPVLAEEEGDSADESAAEHVSVPNLGSAKSRKPIRRPGDYNRYREAMVEICELVKLDGRRQEFYDLLLPLTPKDPSCLDCRPFLNAFASACRPEVVLVKKPKKIKEGDDTSEEEATPIPEPTKIPAQRLPNVGVVDRVVLLSERMALDEKINRQSIEAVDRLIAALQVSEGRTQAQREYFGVLAQFMGYAWEPVRKEIARDARQQAEEEKIAQSAGPQTGFRDQTGFREPSKDDASSTEGLFD